MPTQISTLLQKNFKQLKNQKCITICNIINPLIWLFVLSILREIAEIIVINSLPILKTDVPLIFNIPLYSKLKYSNISSKTTNCEEWYLYDFEEEVNNSETRQFFQKLISQKNMLRTFCNDNPAQFNSSPYFRTPFEAKIYDNETNINTYLYNRAVDLNHIPIKILNEEKALTIVPEGAITIQNLNETYFKFKVQVRDYIVSDYHRGSGVTLFYIFNDYSREYEIFPSSITGSVWEIGIMNKAYMHELFPNIIVNSGVQVLPITPEDNEISVNKILCIVIAGIYPIALSLLIPLFMHKIIYEREKKIIEYLKLNGVKMRNYWISNFIFNYIIYLILAILYFIFEAYIYSINFLERTSFILVSLTLLGWGFGQIGLSYFFQAFVSREKITVILSLSIVFFISFVTLCFNWALYVIPREAPYILNIFPTFALYRIFHYISYSCGFRGCVSSFDKVTTEIKIALVFLYIGGIIFIFLGIFLTEILQKWNTDNKLLSFEEYDRNNNKIKKDNKLITNIEEDNNSDIKNIDNDEYDNKKENLIDKNERTELNNLSIDYPLNDEEINKEIDFVDKIIQSEKDKLMDYPFICKEISDINKNNLDKFSLCLKKNEIIGLLDDRGNGKALFYSILNNIFYSKNINRNIYINGENNNFNINRLIGLVPKNNDILWNDLTVYDTLLFYSKIKNGKKGENEIYNNINLILSKVNLDRHKKEYVQNLKEKAKRRLTLAIALIGEPCLVFIDEPTFGLTPRNKRKIWNILYNVKEDTSMIIISHYMDEIQALCDRVGIISKGKLKYIGNQYKFINGYSKKIKLEISVRQYPKKNNILDNNKLDEIKEEKDENDLINNNEGKQLTYKEKIDNIKYYIKQLFPKGCSVFEECHYTISFKICYDVVNIEQLSKKLEQDKEKLFIENWGISQINLEDIFIKLIRKDL